MKKTAFFLALVMSFLALASCNVAPIGTSATDPSVTPPTDATTIPSTDAPTPLPRPDFARSAAVYEAKGQYFSVDGDFRIISAENSAAARRNALSLRDTIRTVKGLTLEWAEDIVIEGNPNFYVSDHEICIGQVRYRDGYDAFADAHSDILKTSSAVGCFAVVIREEKIFLTAPDEDGVGAAVAFFVAHYLNGGEPLPADLTSVYFYDRSVLQVSGTISLITYEALRADARVARVLLNGTQMAAFRREQNSYDLLIASDDLTPTLKVEAVSPFATVICKAENLSDAAEGQKLTYTLTSADASASVSYTFVWQRGDFTTVQATLHKLKNGATGAITIVQDDGYDKTTEFMLSVCRENGLKFNIAMIANKVGTLAKNADGTYATDENGSFICSVNDNAATAWWQRIVSENADCIEISSHSYTHGAWGFAQNNVEAEIIGSRQLLRTVFPGQKVLTFAYPGFSSATREQEYSMAKGMMPGYYVGARFLSTGRSASLDSPDYFWLGANSFYYSDPAKWGDTSVKCEMTWYINEINRAVTEGSWIVTMNHMIVESLPGTDRNIQITQDYFRYAIETVALPHIRSGKLWNGFFSEVAQYVYEYNHSDMTARRFGDGHYEVEIAFDAEVTTPELYDYPLTVDLPVDADWQRVTFSYTARDGSLVSDTLTVETAADGSRFVRLQVVPLCTATVCRAD